MTCGNPCKGRHCSAVCRDPDAVTLCLQCGKQLPTGVNRGKPRKFCSKQCVSLSQRTGIACLACGKRTPNFHCSKECKIVAKARTNAATAYKGMIKRTTHTDEPRNAAYRGIEVRVPRDEFLAWAVPLYMDFYKHRPHEVPSVDRIDPKQHYELSNMRVISQVENTLRAGLYLRLLGLSKDKTKKQNLKNIVSAVRVVGNEVGFTLKDVVAFIAGARPGGSDNTVT